MVKLLLLVLAGVVASTAVQTQNAGTGSISGRIVDMDTGQPLPGVRTGSRQTGWAVTDSDGRYILSNVAAGPATIWVQETNGGYLDMTLTPPKRVNVIAGGEVRGVDFRTRMDGQISGRVLDDNGEPVVGIRVSAVELLYGGRRGDFGTGELAPRRGTSAVTDDRGAYRIDGIFAGRKYWILAQSPAMHASPLSDAPADPQSRRAVAIPTYYPNAPTLTTATPITVRSLEHRTNVDIRMLTAQPYCLEATLRSGNTPASMRFAVESDAVPSDALAILQRAPLSPADGRIRICDLYRGSFRLLAASGPATGTQLPDYFGVASINIGNSDVVGLNVTTLPPATVSGDVVWDPDADASLQSALRLASIPRHILTTPNIAVAIPGTFSIPVLPMLRYGLMLFPALPSGQPGRVLPSLYVKDVTYDRTSVRRQPFLPGSGRLRIVVSDNAGTLRIRVNANGQPAPSVAVMVLPVAAQSEGDLAAALVAGWTDDAGSFTATGLPPGMYTALATKDPPTNRTLLPWEPGSLLDIDKTPDNMSRLLRAMLQGQRAEIGPRGSVEIAISPVALPN